MIFEDITFTWGDEEFTVKGDDKVMMLIAKVEDFITLQELYSGNPKMSKLAAAYAAALNFAGAKATQPEVYRSLFQGNGEGAALAVGGLLSLMIPPEEMLKHQEPSEKKQPKAKKKQ